MTNQQLRELCDSGHLKLSGQMRGRIHLVSTPDEAPGPFSRIDYESYALAIRAIEIMRRTTGDTLSLVRVRQRYHIIRTDPSGRGI